MRNTVAPVASSSAREVRTGVRWATPSIRRAAAWTSSSVIIAPAGWRTSRRRRGATPGRGRAARRPQRRRRPRRTSSPEAISRSGGRSISAAISSSSGQTRLASTVGAHGPGARRRSQRVTVSATPFASAAASVAATDSRSWSHASTGSKPSRAAATARIPEPQPQSASGPPGGRSASSASVSRVLGCAPVPNACPGSITTSSAPGRSGAHGARTRSGPTSSGRCQSRQSEPSDTSLVETSTSAPPATARSSPTSGSSPGAP